MSDSIFALSDLECSPIQSELHDLFPLRLFEFVADINKQKEGRALVVTDLIDCKGQKEAQDFCCHHSLFELFIVRGLGFPRHWSR